MTLGTANTFKVWGWDSNWSIWDDYTKYLQQLQFVRRKNEVPYARITMRGITDSGDKTNLSRGGKIAITLGTKDIVKLEIEQAEYNTDYTSDYVCYISLGAKDNNRNLVYELTDDSNYDSVALATIISDLIDSATSHVVFGATEELSIRFNYEEKPKALTKICERMDKWWYGTSRQDTSDEGVDSVILADSGGSDSGVTLTVGSDCYANYEKKDGGGLITHLVGFSTDNNTGGISSEGYIAVAIGSTSLNEALDDSETSIDLLDASSFPTSGTIEIGSEEITYTGVSTNTLTGCTRGANATVAAAHSLGDSVTLISAKRSLLADPIDTLLDENLTATDTSIDVVDASGLPSSGKIQIGGEEITYTGKSTNTLTGCTRGANSTRATNHNTNDEVINLGSGGTITVSVVDGTNLPSSGTIRVGSETFTVSGKSTNDISCSARGSNQYAHYTNEVYVYDGTYTLASPETSSPLEEYGRRSRRVKFEEAKKIHELDVLMTNILESYFSGPNIRSVLLTDPHNTIDTNDVDFGDTVTVVDSTVGLSNIYTIVAQEIVYKQGRLYVRLGLSDKENTYTGEVKRNADLSSISASERTKGYIDSIVTKNSEGDITLLNDNLRVVDNGTSISAYTTDNSSRRFSLEADKISLTVAAGATTGGIDIQNNKSGSDMDIYSAGTIDITSGGDIDFISEGANSDFNFKVDTSTDVAVIRSFDTSDAAEIRVYDGGGGGESIALQVDTTSGYLVVGSLTYIACSSLYPSFSTNDLGASGTEWDACYADDFYGSTHSLWFSPTRDGERDYSECMHVEFIDDEFVYAKYDLKELYSRYCGDDGSMTTDDIRIYISENPDKIISATSLTELSRVQDKLNNLVDTLNSQGVLSYIDTQSLKSENVKDSTLHMLRERARSGEYLKHINKPGALEKLSKR